jgi:hypothetical protein
MRAVFTHNLAAAFLSGPWVLDELAERGARACGQRPRWLRRLALRLLTAFPVRAPDENGLRQFLNTDAAFQRMWMTQGRQLAESDHEVFWAAPTMTPAAWSVPPLATEGALAEWLGLTPGQLDGFADCQGREADTPAGPLRHYTYAWRAGRRGKWRLLEIPKPRLKALQRRLLHEILDHVPAHDAAHGYRAGRSLTSYVAPHVGRALVLRFDLRNFFPSIQASRVHALFRTAGYPTPVARRLTGLCTNVVPAEVIDAVPRVEEKGPSDRLLRFPHLPQGAPTSAALANLCAYRLDCRLAGLARSVGAQYTRYADDLAFSGDEQLERRARRFQVAVCRIALEEGFEVHVRKTRFMRRSVRQQLCGIVVNACPNLPRAEFDRLKAILHNCVRHGPETQNRDGREDFRAYLAGRVAYVAMLHPARGHRLRAVFDRIVWGAGPGPE